MKVITAIAIALTAVMCWTVSWQVIHIFTTLPLAMAVAWSIPGLLITGAMVGLSWTMLHLGFGVWCPHWLRSVTERMITRPAGGTRKTGGEENGKDSS